MICTSIGATPADPGTDGRAALAQGAWSKARAAFAEALLAHETPETLEGLGMAAAWLDDAAVMFGYLPARLPPCIEDDDRRSAARVAIALAKDYFMFRGELAIANGWLQRARRILRGVTAGPELGWLAICQAHIAVYTFDCATALECSTQALALGTTLRDINLEMLALAYKGLALVIQGAIDEGMRYLDEATTAIIAGEMTESMPPVRPAAA